MKKKDAAVSRTDIDLCFKALGLPYDAPPEKIEQAYTAYMERCRRNLLSADPVKRENTKKDMDTIADIYFKIKKSVTYADRLKHAPTKSGGSDDSAMGIYIVIAICVLALTVGVWYMMK